MLNQIIYSGYGVTIALVFSLLAMSAPVGAQTTLGQETPNVSVEQMIAQVQQLLEMVAELQRQLASRRGEMREVLTTARENLALGMSGDDVRELQTLLATDSSIYPDGIVTGYYGPLTREAISRFQARHGLPVTGVVDRSTLQKLREVRGLPTMPRPEPPSISPVLLQPSTEMTEARAAIAEADQAIQRLRAAMVDADTASYRAYNSTLLSALRQIPVARSHYQAGQYREALGVAREVVKAIKDVLERFPIANPVMCTADAKLCPDGSYVGRTGPNCEFICPPTRALPPTTPPGEVICTMDVKLCPDGSYVGRTGPNCEFLPCSTLYDR